MSRYWGDSPAVLMAKPDPAADLAACVQALQDIIAAPGAARGIAEKALAGIIMGRMGVAAAAPGRVSVRIPALPNDCRKGWAKWVFRTDPKAAGGFMFEGPFLPLGKPAALPPGAVVLYAAGPAHVHRALAYIVLDNGELCAEPIRADREDWSEMAERIGDYLQHARETPLFSAREWGPAPVPPPLVIPPTVQLAVHQALAAAPPAASDPPSRPRRKAAVSRRRSVGAGSSQATPLPLDTPPTAGNETGSQSSPG